MVRAFLARVDPAARGALGEDPRLPEVLDAHLVTARSAWPAVTIEPDRFAGELAHRLGDGATMSRLEAQQAADVYLAIACGDGSEHAIAACSKLLADEVA